MQGYVRCPEVCSAETPAEDCKCSCPMVKGSWSMMNASEILDKTGVYNVLGAQTAEDMRNGYLNQYGLDEVVSSSPRVPRVASCLVLLRVSCCLVCRVALLRVSRSVERTHACGSCVSSHSKKRRRDK